jgi:hypothetical protein
MKQAIGSYLAILAFVSISQITLAAGFTPPRVFAQGGDAQIDRLNAMDQKCEEARAKALAPIRAKKIEECVNQERRDRRVCELEFSSYGDTRPITYVGRIEGDFYDLPECQAAKAAWKAWEDSKGRR